MRTAADRMLGIALIGLAAFIAVQAMQLKTTFSYEPVGPKAFPIVLAIVLALLALVMVFRPGPDGEWPHKALARCCWPMPCCSRSWDSSSHRYWRSRRWQSYSAPLG